MRAYEALGGLTYWQSDFGSMAEAYQRALELSRELGDPLEEAHALHNASYAPNQRGDTEDSRRLPRGSSRPLPMHSVTMWVSATC